MKEKFGIVFMAVVLAFSVFAFASCDKKGNGKGESDSASIAATHNDDRESTDARISVVYFSATGNTRKAASNLAVSLGAKMFEIIPSKPYSQADLDWNNVASRFSVEYKSGSARPEISNDLSDILNSDIIVLGYPIWGNRAPKIIYSLLDKHDLWSKRIYLFCTSGSDSIKNSMDELRRDFPGLEIVDGIRLDPDDEKAAENWSKVVRSGR